MPSLVKVTVEPRYMNGSTKKLVPTMLEVHFTREGGLHKTFLKTEKERIREVMQESSTKQCVRDILEPYKWENMRICTRNRIADEAHTYVWKIEQRLLVE